MRVVDTDSLPLPMQWAFLHHVTAEQGEVVDSQRTDGRGRYALRRRTGDTAGTLVVSVRHHGVAYFSAPIEPGSDSVRPLAVYDTSAVEPAIGLGERHLIVQPREPDGTRRVIELLILVNRGTKTRVAPDTSRPVFTMALPPNALEFEVGAADVSEQAIYRRGDSMAVAAPFPPGERQVLVSYLLTRAISDLAIPLPVMLPRLNVLLADSSAAAGAPLVFRGWEELQDTRYRRFAADSLSAGTVVSIQFGRAGVSAEWGVAILVGLAAVALAVALTVWLRRAPRAAAQDALDVSDPEVLAAQVAALDAAFRGREDERYHERRRVLVEHLNQALARRKPAP